MRDLSTGTYWLVAWYRELPPRPAACDLLFNRLLRKLARRGIERKPSEDTRAFLSRITPQELDQKEQLARIIDLYNRIKYGRNGDSPLALHQMRKLIDSLQT